MDGLTIAATRPRRQRRRQNLAEDADDDYSGGSRRFKVKVGQGGPGGTPQDNVGWDRELDSDPDEPLAVEEQFILRVPPEIAPKLREQVDKRDVPADTWFKFKDSRRAVFHLGDKLYGAKLVDLPALIESQRLTGSGTGGQTVKVADVSQMLLVEEEIKEEAEVTRNKVFNIEDFVYPHGITPPLKHVRKRRFRRRINRRVRFPFHPVHLPFLPFLSPPPPSLPAASFALPSPFRLSFSPFSPSLLTTLPA
jgi:transcription initiation factor TFIID subunit 7